MTPEAKVKKTAVKHLKDIGAYYFFPATGGYGKSGVPDIVACYQAGNNTPTPLQEKNLKEINEAGGFDLVVHEENVHQLSLQMDKWVTICSNT
jgi:hypothetical protein